MYRKFFSHRELSVLISTTQEQQRQRLDTAAPTYRHAVFRNPPPQVIYSNTDTTDRAIHVPAHYRMTQTGLFALLLQIRRVHTSIYDITRKAKRCSLLL